MSKAKIVAALVKAGHEDLAAELIATTPTTAAKRLTKAKIIDLLFDIIEAANAADSEYNTDLPEHAADSNGLYGHIEKAILSLGAKSKYEHWLETNERDE